MFGDENAIPTAGNQKTLHQRNKSSPALSTMINAGGVKLGAKRTAFGDVSNTANISRPSKDDSAIGGKGDHNNLEKTMLAQQVKKTTSFLRPAQRPMTISGLKSLINNVPNSSSQPLVKQPSVEVQQHTQPSDLAANTRKLLPKKSTAIFKDTLAIQVNQSVPEHPIALESAALVAPVHRELQTKQQSKTLVDYTQPQPRLTQKPSKHVTDYEPQAQAVVAQPTSVLSEENPALKSDGIYIDEQGEVQSYDYIDPVDLPNVISVEKGVVGNDEVPKQIGRTTTDYISDAPLVESKPTRKSTLTTVSEPEEYWDDEGEENYDEEGYVTARSFKSKGDNTTGGATTVLFPKLNQKAKKEIAAAKILIEGSKTREELEDEAWDTTMVAEYGEEIFQYMKDLEVIDTWLHI